MVLELEIGEKCYLADMSKPIDVSIPLRNTDVPKAFYAPDFKTEPVRTGSFVGSTKEGGAVNFFNIFVNPHGNGTHTECVGHISKNAESINDCLKEFHFSACLLSVRPELMENGDLVVMPQSLLPFSNLLMKVDAVLMRTIPNDASKKSRNYSGTNPAYIHYSTIEKLNEHGVKHFLLDLPSVDRELDEGKLVSHKTFWNYPDNPNREKTITEMIYVENKIEDGLYALNLQIGSYELDASPSKPIIYRLVEKHDQTK